MYQYIEFEGFHSSEGLEYISYGLGRCYVKGVGTCTDTDIIIPSVSPDGEDVIGIEKMAFFGCTKLNSIIIPNSVKNIKSNAFGGCTGLISITIPFVGAGIFDTTFGYIFGAYSYSENSRYVPSSLKTVIITGGTSIGSYAFYGCTGLTNITILGYITRIGVDAFSGCTGLTSLTIPYSVTNIDICAFRDCSGLENIIVENGNTKYHSNGNCLIETESKKLILGCKNSVIPTDGSVTSIGGDAFYGCTGLTSITIPESIIKIGYGAFCGCTGLTNITIPFVGATKNGTTNTHFGFIFGAYSTNENSSYVPESLKTVIITGGTSIGHSVFCGCYYISSVTIPNSVSNIGGSAFIYCKRLVSIIIPNSVTNIEKMAFWGCSELTSLNIPNSIMSIGIDAFRDCSGLENIIVENGNTKYHSNGNCLIETESKKLILGCKNSVIPTDGSVTSIGSYAFYGCSGLTSITIPDSVTCIPSNAFSGCTSLTNVTIPDSVKNIESSAFKNCIALASIVIPKNVVNISDDILYNCSSLKSIIVDKDNKVYDSRNNCNAIIEIKTNTLIFGCSTTIIPNSVKSIGSYAFYKCTGLTYITIPNSVTSIGKSAFTDCSSIINIIIPSSVISIGGYAFSACYSLNIFCEAEDKPNGWDYDWNSSHRPVVWGYNQKK